MEMCKMFVNLYLIVTTIISIDSIDVQWSGRRQLSKDYSFLWKTDNINKQVTFRVEVRTRGWIGFGISSNGRMTQSDLIIGWVNDQGKIVFNDYWVDRYETPSLDKSQDWFLTSGSENSSHTTLEFYRKYKTCDTLEDLDIHENGYEQLNIIWAFNEQDPISSQDITKHDKQGVYHMNIFDHDQTFKETDVQVVDFRMNVTVPYSDSISHNYICKFIKTTFTKNVQFIKYHVIYEPPGLKTAIHINLLRCPSTIFNEIAAEFNEKEMACNGEPQASLTRQCRPGIFAGNGLSDEPFVLPPDTGLAFNIDSPRPFVMMQALFMNKQFKPAQSFSVSLRFWATAQLRKFVAGQSEMGPFFGSGPGHNWGLLVPPKEPEFITTSVVDTHCYEHLISEQGIYIFAAKIHTHIGRITELRHYRHGQLLRVLRHSYYSFWNQPLSPVRPHLNVRKRDKLVIICISNSTHLNKTVMPPEEDCMLDIAYYPKITGLRKIGVRIPYWNMLKITGLKEIEGYSTETMTDTVIRSPAKYTNTNLFEFLTENKYQMNHAQLQKYLINSHLVQCCDYYLKNMHKECKIITKPSRLFQSLMTDSGNARNQNSCEESEQVTILTKSIFDKLQEFWKCLKKHLIVTIDPEQNTWVLVL